MFTFSEKYQRKLKGPVYTRPQNYKGFKVPEVLLSGDHKKIKEWKKKESIKITRIKRPDLFKKVVKKWKI